MRRFALTLLGALALAIPAAPAAADPWFKTDTHVHSIVSGDATDDIGIISKAAKERGYDVLMLTDHTATSNHEIGGVVANNVTLDEDDFQNWTSRSFGTVASFSDEEAFAPTFNGAKSLHLASTTGAGAYGEQFRWYKRGPNLRTGDTTLKFSVYPTQIDAGSGLYVSLSLGGDATITSRPPQGYTTNDGVVHAGKTNVLVWQLGNPRVPSSVPDARVTTHQLGYTLNQWNTYTINVSQAIRDEIPAAEMPMDLNAITQLKMAAGGQGGTAEGYFDAYSLKASAPVSSADEFVYRNTHVADFNTSDFTIYPSQEVGYNRHVMRFNFGITDPSQYAVFNQGIASIQPTQQTGYPVQLNHPGLPGGVTQQEAIDNFSYGSDLMEVAERSDEEGYIKNVMVDAWDGVLEQGVQLIGMWTSDMHRVERFGPATYIQAPNRSFDALMQSMYEGRTYLAPNDFSGRAIFNLDGGPDPYAARYPTWVSPSQTMANAEFSIDQGITAGSRVIWTRNGQQMAVDHVDGPSYHAVKTIPLGGPFTYVRAELRNANGVRIAMSQPIFFNDAPGLLPAGMTYNVTRVTTPTGNGYTKLATQGITSRSWDTSARKLSLGLTNPSGSLDALRVTTGGLAPSAVQVDGANVPAAASAAAFGAATGSSWWFDPAKRVLLLKAKQAGGTAALDVTFSDGGDTAAPATPGGVSAHAQGAERIDVSWSPSAASDLEGYTVYRDGTPIALVPAGTTHLADQPLAAGTHYTYTVDAFDFAENHSPVSDPASATTDTVTISTFEPVADSYVDSSQPNTKFGTSTSLRIDGSPVIRTYLRFDVSGLSGTIEQATLRLFNNSKSAGHDIHSADNAWSESTINFANAPGPGGTLFGSSNGGEAGTWSTADVTSLVTGDGTITAEVDTIGSAGINYSSREGANPPQLVVETSVPSNDPPEAHDRSILTGVDAAAAWTPSVNDPDGDAVTCTIVSQPASGTATVASDCSSGTYTPASGFHGSESFTYRATDGPGVDSNDATVSVVVNRPPAAAAASVSTSEDSAGSWNPAASDPDGDGVTCAIVSPPAHGTAAVTSDCSSGTYTPTGDYHGSDSFTYAATDSHGFQSGAGTVSASVSAVNDAPAAAAASVSTDEDVQGSWTPSATDVDGDTPACAIADAPAHGSATVASDCSGGTYTPAADYHGPDSFTYRATDGHGGTSSAATVTAAVAAVNDAPGAADRSLTTAEDAGGSWTPSVSDVDGDSPTCAIVSPPAHGSATVAANCSGGTYTPTGDYHGPDSFTYRSSDGHGGQSDAATVSVTVTSVNDAPAVAAASLSTTEDAGEAAWTPSATDIDGDTPACAIADAPAHGSATVASDCSGGTYTPAADYSGPDSFTYRATDGHGGTSSAATVSVSVSSVNDAPGAADRSLTTPEDAGGSWTPSVSDVDGDSPTCAIVAPPAHGTATVAANCSSGTYTPTGDYHGPDSFTYRSSDGHGGQSGAATVSVTVTSVNDAPTAAAGSLDTGEDHGGSWTPAVVDKDGDALTCEVVSGPAHGSAGVASDCSGGSYEPDPDYHGGDSFTYRTLDGHGGSSGAATVSVSVASVNDAPSAGARSISTPQDAPSGWAPDVADRDGGALTCELVSQPAHGTATVAHDCSGGGYTPADGYTGPDAFSYRAIDPDGDASDAAPVSVAVSETPLFSDGFETGTLSAWGSTRGLTVQSAFANGGTFAARGSSAAGASWAKRLLPGTYSELTYRVHFRAQRPAPTGSPTVMRLRTGGDRPLASVYLSAGRKLGLRNDVIGTSSASSTSLSLGRWYELQLHAVIHGAASTLELRLDGHRLADVSTTSTDLGITDIGMLQIGENSNGPTYDFLYDDVSAQRTVVGNGGTAALHSAPRCTNRSGVKLSASGRQHVGRTGIVLASARSKATCKLKAVATAKDARGRRLVTSRALNTVLPAGHRGSLSLHFATKARKRIQATLKHRPVYVLIYIEPGADPIARRKVRVTR